MSRIPGWTLAVSSIAIFMVSLDNLVVTNALTSIREDLGASLEALEWTVNAYTLAFAVFLLTGAALGDRFGRRRMFLVGLGIFTAASAAAALAPSTSALIAARGFQGLGAAILAPLSLTLLSTASLGREARARARRLVRRQRARRRPRPAGRRRGNRGHLVAVDLLAQRAGRPRRSRRSPHGGWRRAMACRAARPRRPGAGLDGTARRRLRRRPRQPGRLGLGRGGRLDRGRSGAAGGVRRLGAARRAPMLPLRFFRSRQFAATNGVSLAMTFGIFGSIFLLAQFFQTVQGYSPLEAGLRTLPWTGMPMLVAPVAGILSDRLGSRPLMATGLFFQAIAIMWIAAVSEPDVATACWSRRSSRRHGHGAGVRAGGERGARRGPAGGGRTGLGRQQRDPRARRRPRRGRPRRDLHRRGRLRDAAGVRRRAQCPRCGPAPPCWSPAGSSRC